MKIQITNSNSPKLQVFNKHEWPLANIEHYGANIDWKTNNYTLTASEDNAIVGTLGLKTEAGVAYIGTMLVAKASRKKGIGKALMEKAHDLAKQDNCHKIYLQTGKDWESVKFYQKLGYNITGELKDHYFRKDFVELTLFI